MIAYELNDRCYIKVSLRPHCVLTDQWADDPYSYATNIGGSSAGDRAVRARNSPSSEIYGTLPAVPGYFLGPLLMSRVKFICGIERCGDRGSTVVKVMCYKSVGRWFDPSWCHWNFSLT